MMGKVPLLFFFQRALLAAALFCLRLILVVNWLWAFLQAAKIEQALF
jgi:hypothetical protein